jgi:gluconokinase
MEGVAHAYARVAALLPPPARVLASGRVVQDLPEWLQVLADVLGVAVEPVTMKRATLHGTALHALEVLAPDVARAPVVTGETLHPRLDHHGHYRDRAERYDRLYRAVVEP